MNEATVSLYECTLYNEALLLKDGFTIERRSVRTDLGDYETNCIVYNSQPDVNVLMWFIEFYENEEPLTDCNLIYKVDDKELEIDFVDYMLIDIIIKIRNGYYFYYLFAIFVFFSYVAFKFKEISSLKGWYYCCCLCPFMVLFIYISHVLAFFYNVIMTCIGSTSLVTRRAMPS